MATSKKIDKDKLKLPNKKAVVKKDASNNGLDAKVKAIHNEDDKPVRITLDLPQEEIYKPMKRHIVDTEETIKDYIISLIRKDLNLKK